MLSKAGLRIIKWDFVNIEYTFTGLLQTFLNIFFPPDVFYGIVAQRRITLPYWKALFFTFMSIFVAIILSPLIVSFFFVELVFKKTGAFVIIAQK